MTRKIIGEKHKETHVGKSWRRFRNILRCFALLAWGQSDNINAQTIEMQKNMMAEEQKKVAKRLRTSKSYKEEDYVFYPPFI